MPRPLPVDYLQPDEQIVHQGGRHGLSVMGGIIGTFILCGLAIGGVLLLSLGFYPALFLPVALPVIIVASVVFVIYCIISYWRVATTQHTITSERVYYAYGRLRFSISQTTYDKLTDIHVYQGIFGRIYGFGTLRLETAGTGIALHGVRDPFETKQIVEEARSGFIRGLVGTAKAPRITDATATSEAKSDAAPVPEQRTIWSSRPAPASLIGALIGLGVFLLFFIFSGIGSILTAPATGGMSLLAPAFVLLVLVLMTVNVVVRYRFTIFEVGTRGVVVTRGWLSRQRVETTYTKVTDVMVFQSFMGRMLDYGNITVNTAGSNNAPVVFQGVPKPEQVKQLIDEQRDA